MNKKLVFGSYFYLMPYQNSILINIYIIYLPSIFHGTILPIEGPGQDGLSQFIGKTIYYLDDQCHVKL